MIDANKINNLAKKYEKDIIGYRRDLHKIAEVGDDLPKTKAYVKEKLKQMGYNPKDISKSGVLCDIINDERKPCFLLRADMDALFIKEKTGLEFSSKENMHACGHDMHTAMLLGAAKILKEYKDCKNIRLVFQPNEEGLKGALDLIENKVLENPKVYSCMALHVISGVGTANILYKTQKFMAGCMHFEIEINGKSAHSSKPEEGVDSIDVGVKIYMAINDIINKEVSAMTPALITIGKFNGGESVNVVAKTTVIKGNIRGFDEKIINDLYNRIKNLCNGFQKIYSVDICVKNTAYAPPLDNDEKMTNKLAEYIKELVGDERVYELSQSGMGSEDFSSFSKIVPSSYFLIGAGSRDENELYGEPMHSDKVIFNEDVLSIGSSIYAYCALKWAGQEIE